MAQARGRLFSKRLEKGRFVWPPAKDGKVCVTSAQLAMLLEGINWRMPQRTWRPLQLGWASKTRVFECFRPHVRLR